MAITAAFEGSATIGTSEYSCPAATTTGVPTSQTDDGIYQAFFDFNALAAGDDFEIALYEKVQSSGTQRLVEKWVVDGAQGKPHTALPSFILLHGWDITLKKIAGTDRSIGYSIRKVA